MQGGRETSKDANDAEAKAGRQEGKGTGEGAARRGAEKRKERVIVQPEQESSYQGSTGQGNQHARRQRSGGDQSSKIPTKQGPDTRTAPDNISMR